MVKSSSRMEMIYIEGKYCHNGFKDWLMVSQDNSLLLFRPNVKIGGARC